MPKQLRLTAHAQERLRSRSIKFEWIEETIRNPAWTEPDPKNPAVERRFRPIEDFGGRVLRVACVETEATIRVRKP
jgi:hypothetical protein